MSATPSTMKELGSAAQAFELPDVVSGEMRSLSTLHGMTGTVIMFICNHCPYVKHVNNELVNLANDYQAKGIQFIAISSNDVVRYPEDGPEQMKTVASQLKYPFPYLYDETQKTARDYDAACTPDFFIYDSSLKLAYRGQLDVSRPKNNIPVTGKDIRETLDCLLAGKPIPTKQKPSIGCNIKWKS